MIDRQLKNYLIKLADQYPVITLTGPRQSGKTTLCRSTFPELPYVTLESLDTRHLATEDPRGFLKQYPEGAIFDEFQRVPDLPSYLQEVIDQGKQNRLYILTGSQNLKLTNTVNQSLAGRTGVLTLLPLSVSELYEAGLYDSIDSQIFSGGYPRIFDCNMDPTRVMSDYVATYVERDIRELSNIESLPEFQRFLKLSAGRIAQLINYENLGNESGVSGPTVKKWIGLLESTYVTFQLSPYFKNISKRIIKSPKLYFYDVGLACYLLGINSVEQLTSHPLRGALFENLVILECLKQRLNNGLANNLYFYRDSTGNEIDLVLEQALDPHLLEVKSSSTLNRSYQKNFSAFIKATDLQNATKTLVYQGEEHDSAYGMKCINVPSLYSYLSNENS